MHKSRRCRLRRAPVRALCAVAVAAATACAVLATPAVSLADNQSDLLAVQARISEANAAYDAAQARISELDGQIAEAEAQVEEIEAKIADAEALIAEVEAKLPGLRENASSSMRTLYKMQQSSFGLIDLVLSAESFNDLITTVQYLEAIQSRSINALDELVVRNDEYQKTKASLEEQRTELAAVLKSIEEQRAEADAEREQAEAAIAEGNAARADLEAAIAAQAAAEAAARQAAIEAAAAAQAKAQAEAEAAAAAAEAEAAAQAEAEAQAQSGAESDGAEEGEAQTEAEVEVEVEVETKSETSSGTSSSGSATFETGSGNSATVETATSPNASSVDWSLSRDDFIATWTSRINAYLAGSPLAGYGSVFAEAAWEYGVDPRLSPAISNVESSKGRYCFLPHNAWGWGNVSWSSWEEAIWAHTKGLATGYGGTLTYAGAQKYCPPNADLWYSSVLANMEKI